MGYGDGLEAVAGGGVLERVNRLIGVDARVHVIDQSVGTVEVPDKAGVARRAIDEILERVGDGGVLVVVA